ncbi:hypothetical protein [Enterococcus cecorum]|uniref:hypothetical protein n=1 Tax=Enterococcus cecorum TaxID=44008 RepID=UPI001FAC87C9|nr:hypothetical protein [Enterococcus cecorum]MCJ0601283.1 hypothetical protein [Enterococcus cecorum]
MNETEKQKIDWLEFDFPKVTAESYLLQRMLEYKETHPNPTREQVLRYLKDTWSDCLPEESPFHIELYLLVDGLSEENFKSWYISIGKEGTTEA